MARDDMTPDVARSSRCTIRATRRSTCPASLQTSLHAVLARLTSPRDREHAGGLSTTKGRHPREGPSTSGPQVCKPTSGVEGDPSSMKGRSCHNDRDTRIDHTMMAPPDGGEAPHQILPWPRVAGRVCAHTGSA